MSALTPDALEVRDELVERGPTTAAELRDRAFPGWPMLRVSIALMDLNAAGAAEPSTDDPFPWHVLRPGMGDR